MASRGGAGFRGLRCVAAWAPFLPGRGVVRASRCPNPHPPVGTSFGGEGCIRV